MKHSLAFRRYVRRVEKAALAGRLDAIRTLGAITLALAAMTTAGHTATFHDRFTVADAQQQDAPVTPPASPEQWTVNVYLLIDGKPVAGGPVDGPYPSDTSCVAAAKANKTLQTKAQAMAKDAGEKFGPTATVVIACGLKVD